MITEVHAWWVLDMGPLNFSQKLIFLPHKEAVGDDKSSFADAYTCIPPTIISSVP